MPEYEASRFDPPAPAANVALRDAASGKTVTEVLLLLDTGADVTLLPAASVHALGVSPLPNMQYELIGFDGSKSSASVVQIDMLFLNRVFRGRYLLTEDECGVLGRDILNHLALVLDGPRKHSTEQVT
jgi:hypothetical protein